MINLTPLLLNFLGCAIAIQDAVVKSQMAAQLEILAEPGNELIHIKGPIWS
jgi:hypothetical protein